MAWSPKSLEIPIGPEECLEYSTEHESAKRVNGVEPEVDPWEKRESEKWFAGANYWKCRMIEGGLCIK